MQRTFARIPAHFYRVSLHNASADNMTLALVPDQAHAQMIAQLMTEHYGLRQGERIVVSATIVRAADDQSSSHVDLTLA